MKININRKYIILSIRIIIGILFLFSGFSKIISPSALGKIIDSYGIFPRYMIIVFAITIPYLEFIIGLSLILNLKPKWMTNISIIMMIAFTTVSGIMYYKNGISDCGCFGTIIVRKMNWSFFVENIVILIFLFILMFFYRERKIL